MISISGVFYPASIEVVTGGQTPRKFCEIFIVAIERIVIIHLHTR